MFFGFITICLLLLALGAWGFWKMDKAPYPNSMSWLLRIPLPWITNKKLLAVLSPQNKERLLEIGPGTGLQTTAVARRIKRLDIVDIQAAMLKHTMKRVQRHKLSNVFPTQADAERLPFRDQAFDGAYLITTLGETSNPLLVLKELRRVIKPGGRLVIGEWIHDRHGINQAQLSSWLQQAGFKQLYQRGNRLAYLSKSV